MSRPPRMFHASGLPIGITFTKGAGAKPHAIRVTAPGTDTMFAIDRSDVYSVYQRAVEERLHGIGEEANNELRNQFLAAFEGFCEHYQIRLKPLTIHVLASVGGTPA